MNHLKRGDRVRARTTLVLDDTVNPIQHIQPGHEGTVEMVLDSHRVLVRFDEMILPWAVGYNSADPELIEVELIR